MEPRRRPASRRPTLNFLHTFDSLCQVRRAAEDSNDFPPPGPDQDEEATHPQDSAIDLSSTSSLSDKIMSLEQDMEASVSSLSHVSDDEALANVDDDDSESTWDRHRCFKEELQRSRDKMQLTARTSERKKEELKKAKPQLVLRPNHADSSPSTNASAINESANKRQGVIRLQ
jgi:hypothetical protein